MKYEQSNNSRMSKDRPRVRGTNKKLYAVSNCDYSYGCIIN